LPISIRVNEVIETFRLGQIQLAILKCAPRELAWLRGPNTRDTRERRKERYEHRPPAVPSLDQCGGEQHKVEKSGLIEVTTITSIVGGDKATHGWIEEKSKDERAITCYAATPLVP
jgi:hypothetical protein